MRIDLSNIPVIDDHCHAFTISREPQTFEKTTCIALFSVPEEDLRNTLYFQMLINELRRFFHLDDNCSADEVIAKRNDEAFNNRKEYAQAMFAEANIAGFLCDYGSPITRKEYPEREITEAEVAEYLENCGDLIVKPIDRIEWIADRLLKDNLTFEDFEAKLVEQTKQMIVDRNLVALKSVVAYYTGLEIAPMTQQEFKNGYYAYFANKKDWKAEKSIRDFTFIKACEICRDLDVPLQVHTGLGDSPYCHIMRVNPALLTDVMNDPRCCDTKIVMLHGGYPYLEELGMITQHYRNVYADISSFNPFASIALKNKIKNLMELAPLNKVLYGTDGGMMIEPLWYGAIQFKKIFAGILEELINEKYITYDFAMESAENILYKNVRRLYKF